MVTIRQAVAGCVAACARGEQRFAGRFILDIRMFRHAGWFCMSSQPGVYAVQLLWQRQINRVRRLMRTGSWHL